MASFTVEIPHQERHAGETRTHTLFTLDRRGAPSSPSRRSPRTSRPATAGASSRRATRAPTRPPVPALLAILDDEETGGGPRHRPLDMVADGDDIQVRIADSTAPGRYTIVARVELAPEAVYTRTSSWTIRPPSGG